MPEHTPTTPEPDASSPLVLDVRQLGRRPGSMVSVRRVVPAPADLGLEVIGVPEGSEIELNLKLEAVLEGVVVSGRARAQLTGECVRCLDPLDREIDVDLAELFVTPGRDGDDETRWLYGDLIDVEPVLRDAVVLMLPMQPVCREDCPGLCAQCGARLAEDPGHVHTDVDPRWEALRGLVVPDD